MHKKLLESTQGRTQKIKSPVIRQSSSGNKAIKQTSKGEKQLKVVKTKQEVNQNKLTITQNDKNKKESSKSLKKGDKVENKSLNKMSSNQDKVKTKIISYKTQQSQPSSEGELKKSIVDIQMPLGEEVQDDDINLLSISNYPQEDDDGFLRGTYITQGLSKTKYAKQAKQKQIQKLVYKKQQNYKNKHIYENQDPRLKLQIQKKSSKKGHDQLALTKKRNQNIKKSQSGSKKKQTVIYAEMQTIRKTSLKKSIKGEMLLLKSNRGLDKSNTGLLKSNKGTSKQSKTKKNTKKEKSSSNDTRKSSSKKSSKNKEPRGLINGKKKLASPDSKHLRSIPKPPKSQSKDKVSSKNKFSIINPPKNDEASSSDTTHFPTFEQLEKLRQQNQKYKMFLAQSAFKVDELRKQIQESKQVRQTQRNIYNFQLHNLKKQLDSNKKYLGHLFSYDDQPTGNNFLPQQIILQTDNQSSSVLDSVKMLSNLSKLKGSDLDGSNSNTIKKQTEKDIAESNSSSSGADKQLKSYSEIQNKKQFQKDMKQKQQIIGSSQGLRFLNQIKKIPSLKIQLSLQDSQKDSQKQLLTTNYFKQTNKKNVSNSLKNQNLKESSEMNLLIDSKRH